MLIVDSVFAFRPEYDRYQDFRIWLDIDPELSLKRGVERVGNREGSSPAEQLHRDRYHASERTYIEEVDPVSLAMSSSTTRISQHHCYVVGLAMSADETYRSFGNVRPTGEIITIVS